MSEPAATDTQPAHTEPAHTEPAQHLDGEPAAHAAAGSPHQEGMPSRAVATWEATFWGHRRGHAEEVDVTAAVLGAAADGKLTLATMDGEPIPVPRVQRPARPAAEAVRPPSAREAARAQAAAARRPARPPRTGRRGG